MFGIDERALRVAWTVFLFALLLTVVYFIRSTLLLFGGAIFFAYMLSPVVALIERFIPRRRSLALGLVYVAFVGLLVFIGFELLPTFAREATSLVQTLPSRITTGSLARIPLPHFLEPVRDQIIAVLDKGATNLASSAVPFLQRAGTEIISGLGAVLPAILVPILAFFFLKDARSIRANLLGAVEDGHDRSTAALILADVHQVLRNYIRALVLLAIAAFVFWATFLSVMRYPYELLLAGIAARLGIHPRHWPSRRARHYARRFHRYQLGRAPLDHHILGLLPRRPGLCLQSLPHELRCRVAPALGPLWRAGWRTNRRYPRYVLLSARHRHPAGNRQSSSKRLQPAGIISRSRRPRAAY